MLREHEWKHPYINCLKSSDDTAAPITLLVAFVAGQCGNAGFVGIDVPCRCAENLAAQIASPQICPMHMLLVKHAFSHEA